MLLAFPILLICSICISSMDNASNIFLYYSHYNHKVTSVDNDLGLFFNIIVKFLREEWE